MLHHQIVIVGGGPVGLSMALFLARQNKKVTVIDQGLDYSQDARVLALSFASKQILKQINSWNEENATPIKRVQISHAGLGISNIDATSLGLDDLGYTVSYAGLCKGLTDKVRVNTNIELIIARVVKVTETGCYACITFEDVNGEVKEITADLVIMAEGGKLLDLNRKKINHDYDEKAVVARVRLKAKTDNVAYERFTEIGPLVLLPFQDEYIVVWALNANLADDSVTDKGSFIDLLNRHYTSRFGGARLIGDINCFPLKLVQINKRFNKRIVMIGNSAQTVHPVSAQGLNLGLRDVTVLDMLIGRFENFESFDLTEFDQLRDRDADHVVGFTHFLATFTHRQGEINRHLRGAGLIALSNLPVIQNKIAKRLIYGS